MSYAQKLFLDQGFSSTSLCWSVSQELPKHQSSSTPCHLAALYVLHFRCCTVRFTLYGQRERGLYYALCFMKMSFWNTSQNHQVSRVKKPWISGSNFSKPWRHSTLPIATILLHHNSHCGNLCWCFWSSYLLNLHCWLTLVPFKLPNKFRRTFSRVSFLTNWFHSAIRTLIISVYIYDSKHSICQPDDSKHSILWHLCRRLKKHNIRARKTLSWVVPRLENVKLLVVGNTGCPK